MTSKTNSKLPESYKLHNTDPCLRSKEKGSKQDT